MGSIGFILSSIATLLFLFAIYGVVGGIGEWTQLEAIFLFSFVSLSRAIWSTFMFNMTSIGNKVKSGTLDKYLFRPINPLFQILSEKLDPDTIGEILFSIVLLVYCLTKLNLLNIGFIILIVIFLLSSVICLSAIHLIINTFSFWIIDNTALNFIIWRLDELAIYPFDVYPNWLRYLLTLIPFGFVGYYPLNFLLHKSSEFYMLSMFSPLISLLFFWCSYLFWKKGLSNYQSTGS
ncbi:ABC transporter permease [Paenibacillus campi]|uniref:ABC transporter permease n=1 Tax=Paenibacillus campi TaxID=3106031 RepID=UPI002AFE04C7|nr:ABC-2 family transporter protein [Paenibacillus sp. SGZ-1014]